MPSSGAGPNAAGDVLDHGRRRLPGPAHSSHAVGDDEHRTAVADREDGGGVFVLVRLTGTTG